MLMKLKKFYLIAALMAAPAASFATEYFVTPEGRGNGDGSSWDDAMSFDVMYGKINEFENGDVFYFAGGTYYTPKVVAITNGYTFIGGFNPELKGTAHETPAYPSSSPTVFSGDTNKDGVMGEGDLDRLLAFRTETKDDSKKVILTGLDFTRAYSVANTGTHGALHVRNCGYVEVNNCRFYNNVDDKYYGGMAFTGDYSTVYFNDCKFTGNKAYSRGGAIRLSSNSKEKGVTVLNRCLIEDNEIQDNTGSAICVQQGLSLYIINSTITGNTAGKTSGAIFSNGEGDTYMCNVYIVGSTIAGNEGGSQVEMSDNANIYVANSIVVSNDDEPAFSLKSVKTGVSGGMNILGEDASSVFKLGDTDNAEAGNNYAAIFGDNVLGANGVIEPLADEGKYKASALAAAVEGWGIKADLTVDQTGAERADGSTPGAYAKSTATGITGVEAVKGGADDAYYTLQGVKLGSRPTATGIYIHNGKKVIIR